ncbi:hypothetical protein SAMN05443247_11648 [Bradyrhizobium erythrophlei]|nr:hypothetical protein SAMN05443247_11648 [Bradyrhizobium erythrophlei]
MRMHPDDITDVIVHDPHPQTGGWRTYPEIECLYRGYAPGKSMDVHQIIHNAAKKAKKKRGKVTEQILIDTYEAVTRRAVEKVMKRRATAKTVGSVARLGQLMTSGGATPFPGQQEPELSPQDTTRPDAECPIDVPSDPTAARTRLMSSRPNVASSPMKPFRDTISTNDSSVNDDEY